MPAAASIPVLYFLVYGLFAGDVVGNSKGSATFGATACKHLAAIFSSHSLAETVLVNSATVGRLKSSFHCMIYLIFYSNRE